MRSMVKVQTPAGVRAIGIIDGTVFRKQVRKSVHFHRNTNSWGIQKTALELLLKRGVLCVEILDTESGTRYVTKLRNFVDYGFTLTFGPHGEQVFLPLRYWQVKERRICPCS